MLTYQNYIRQKKSVNNWVHEFHQPGPNSSPVTIQTYHPSRQEPTKPRLLVNSLISQQGYLTSQNYWESRQDLFVEPPWYKSDAYRSNLNKILLYRDAAEIVPNFRLSGSGGGGQRGKIDAFSDASRRRLRQKAANCFPAIQSQFLLTYHENMPDNGADIKQHLNSWLTRIRNKFKGIKYIWVLEFTTKAGRPHIHVYLTMPPNRSAQLYMAVAWRRITSETYQHLKVHLHDTNFVAWDMKKGGYVCKYLEKSEQKLVPEGFSDVGRFWGSSRGIMPVLEEITSESINAEYPEAMLEETGEITRPQDIQVFILRTLRKYQEKKVRFTRNLLNRFGGKKFKSPLRRPTKCIINGGTEIVARCLNWLTMQPEYQQVPF